jgi:hypothetical protein
MEIFFILGGLWVVGNYVCDKIKAHKAQKAEIYLMVHHPEVWDRVVAKKERQEELRQEKRQKMMSVAGPLALGLAQKVLSKR